jgi:hypothetical protein
LQLHQGEAAPRLTLLSIEPKCLSYFCHVRSLDPM